MQILSQLGRPQVFPLTRLAFDLGVEDVNVLGTFLYLVFPTVESSYSMCVTCCDRSRLVERRKLDCLSQRPRMRCLTNMFNSVVFNLTYLGAGCSCFSLYICQCYTSAQKKRQSQRVCQRVRHKDVVHLFVGVDPFSDTPTLVAAPYYLLVMAGACVGPISS